MMCFPPKIVVAYVLSHTFEMCGFTCSSCSASIPERDSDSNPDLATRMPNRMSYIQWMHRALCYAGHVIMC